MRLAAFFLCLYVWCLHLLFLPCDEIARNGGGFLATKLQGTVASLRRNRRGGWLLCDEIAGDGGFLATKSQGTVASLQGTVDEGGDREKIKKMQREVASL